MCYHGKCLLCIPVEKGSFVCAIIISILTGLSLLISTILGALTASGLIYFYNPVGEIAGFFILAMTSLGGLVFAVLLCHGISKRRPVYVKAYFIYGVVITALAVLVAMILLLVGHKTVSVLMIASCVIYSLFLVLVQKTYFIILKNCNGGTVVKPNQLIDS